MKTFIFHIDGIHCPSCKILIEDILSEIDSIQNVEVNVKTEQVSLTTSDNIDNQNLLKIINAKIKTHGYTAHQDKPNNLKVDKNLIWKAVPIGLVVLLLFFVLQKSGILNFSINGSITPTTSFIIGLVASVSTCLAIVGGLVLSISAKISQDNVSDTQTFVLFHIGRILGFAFLGGIFGFIGDIISINLTVTSILGLLAATIMILLGLNLVGILKKNKITLSPTIFNFFRRIEHKPLTPILVGIGTFFLPCGFTQSMQLAALTSGSFFTGSMIMLFFALGTFPTLALISFGSASFAHSKYSALFFKSAGVVVLGLGLLTFVTGLISLGVINPIINI